MELLPASGVSAAPPRARRAFRVRLDGSDSVEIDFRQLVRASEASIASSGPATPADGSLPPPELPVAEEPPPPAGARSQRFSIIERLEKRYGSGAVVHLGEGGEDAAREKKKKATRRDDDDLYDLDDPFIDDAELQHDIEEVHTLARVKTKHSGFFVNAGDEIETLARDDRCVLLPRSSDADARANSTLMPALATTTRGRARAGAGRRVKRPGRSWTSCRTPPATGSRRRRSFSASRCSATKSASVSRRCVLAGNGPGVDVECGGLRLAVQWRRPRRSPRCSRARWTTRCGRWTSSWWTRTRTSGA